MFPSRSSASIGPKILITLVALGILAGVAVVSDPRKREPGGITTDEQAVLMALEDLAHAQQRFAANAVLDFDGDGRGEFGFLGELAGSARLRLDDRGNLADQASGEPELPLGFATILDGTAFVQDYHLHVLLPAGHPTQAAADRDPLEPLPEWYGESESGGGGGVRVDTDRAEQQWCVLAWPGDRARGALAFFRAADGAVYAFEPEGRRDGYRGLSRRPDADAALPADGESFGQTYRGRDGRRWRRVR